MNTALRTKLNKLLEKHKLAKQQIKREEQELSLCTQKLKNELHAQRVLQKVAQSVQQNAHAQIARVVTKCLSMVFTDPYEFEIEFVRKRGKTEAVLVFKRDDLKVNPIRAAGGGVVDVAAFALRLACMSLQQPAPRQFVALDEPFKHVSLENQERIKDMLEMLSQEMGIQFLFATHEDELHCGKIINLRREKRNGSV